MAVDFYKNLLGTITMQFEEEKASMVSHLFTVKNSIAMVESLQRVFIDEEIWNSIFSHTGNKAPGLDGFLLGFFHRAWLVVQNEVVAAVKSFFANEF